MSINPHFGYVFPAIRGIQARREYYVSMCALRLIPRIFLFDEEEITPELRAQRTLNKGRIPDISRYILNNRDDYVFSAITASIDGDVKFEPLAPGTDGGKVGMLHVPMDARFIINDGQHRRAAIERALREIPEVGDETIAVVFFLDKGLDRCQQMFADLNRYPIRPSRSLSVLYDQRDELAQLTKLVVLKSSFFQNIVEMERPSLSQRSQKLFTLSALYSATSSLLDQIEIKDIESGAKIATEYWEYIAKQFPEWQMVRERKMSAGEVRRDFIHSHGVVLHSLGIVGNNILSQKQKEWKACLRTLRKIDWSKSNSKLWEGRAMIGGKVSKNSHNLKLTTNIIKQHLNIKFTPEERKVEDAFLKSRET